MAKQKKQSLVEKYLHLIKEAAGGHACIYRGQADAEWRLESAAERRIRKAIEKDNEKIDEIPSLSLVNYHDELLDDARQKGFDIRDGRELSDLELLTDLQHFGAATCLLDFSTEPLVALYFACADAIKFDEQETKGDNRKEKQVKKEKKHGANEKEKIKCGKLFILQNANLRIAPKNDSIEKIIESEDLVQWRPKMHGAAERRIIRQSGASIINLKPDEESLPSIDILSDDKNKILEELRHNYQISADTLFIDLAGFADNRSHDKNLDTFWVWFYRGHAKVLKGDLDGAITNYDEAIRLKLDFFEAYCSRGAAKLSKQDFDAAIEDCTESIRLKPDYALAYFGRGSVKFNKEDFDGAIKDFDEAIGIDPGMAESYRGRGVAKSKNEDFDGAIKDFTEAIRLKPDNFDAYLNCGVAKLQKSDWGGAIKDFDEAIRLKPDFAEAHLYRGLAKSRKRDFGAAVKDFGKAIRINPDYAEAYANRGIAKLGRNTAKSRKRDFERAIKDFDEAIRLKPDYAEAYCNRGDAKWKKGDWDGAITDCNKAICLKPDYDDAYCNRGNAKSEKGKGDLDGAMKDFDKAIRINRNSFKGHYSRGLVKEAQKDGRGAIEDYQKASDLAEEQKLPTYFVDMIELRIGYVHNKSKN